MKSLDSVKAGAPEVIDSSVMAGRCPGLREGETDGLNIGSPLLRTDRLQARGTVRDSGPYGGGKLASQSEVKCGEKAIS
jgi:hypothetical protein